MGTGMWVALCKHIYTPSLQCQGLQKPSCAPAVQSQWEEAAVLQLQSSFERGHQPNLATSARPVSEGPTLLNALFFPHSHCKEGQWCYPHCTDGAQTSKMFNIPISHWENPSDLPQMRQEIRLNEYLKRPGLDVSDKCKVAPGPFLKLKILLSLEQIAQPGMVRRQWQLSQICLEAAEQAVRPCGHQAWGSLTELKRHHTPVWASKSHARSFLALSNPREHEHVIGHSTERLTPDLPVH